MGKSYISKENEKELLQRVLKDKNSAILFISRTPRKETTDNKQRLTQIWLTNIESEFESIRPQDLEQLSYRIEKFIKENKKTIILITGIEYLISYTSFEQTIHFIETIRDIAIIHDCQFIINTGKDTLIKMQENLLEQELEVLE